MITLELPGFRVYAEFMVPVRLLALDMDDTLLRSDLSISFRTRNAVRKAEARGVTIVLASTRAPAVLEHFSDILGLTKRHGYLIANNGTVIQECQTGEIIYEQMLDTAAALLVFDMAHAEGFAVQIYDDDTLYVSRTNEFSEYDKKITGLRQVVVDNFRSMVASGCHKLLIPGDPMILRPLAQLLENLAEDATIHTSKPYRLEILPYGVDKGNALRMIADKRSIPREAVMAVGDSMNDASMLRWAGYPVAMINADPELKDIAALITEKSNDEDGVAEIIEQYILGNGILSKAEQNT